MIDITDPPVSQATETIWQSAQEAVELAPYDPRWPTLFKAERAQIQAVLGGLVIEIHHIGSTAVPGLLAKPIIDIMATVRQLDDAAACIAPLSSLGYTFVDHVENTDRRFFRKGSPRTHHLHIVEHGSDALRRHLAFRDALRANADLREQYAALKTELAARYKNDRARYTDAKSDFVARALTTFTERGQDGIG